MTTTTNLSSFTPSNFVNQLKNGTYQQPKKLDLAYEYESELDRSYKTQKEKTHFFKMLLSSGIPGLGEFCNGEYEEGIKHFLGACITLAATAITGTLGLVSSASNEENASIISKLKDYKKAGATKPTGMIDTFKQKSKACLGKLVEPFELTAKFVENNRTIFDKPAVQAILVISAVGLFLIHLGQHIHSAQDAYKGKKAR